ncbi:hypothetical protein J3R30DRAFT_93338 [Lentinula aciculospora]|uniref:Uncharacterized protein n=1 Tax=Lentinula aciculospora TaxID=153920 RepID=A0A9W9DY38_9AGAR|nr:hypothetical protein J3R30DRAFT_93338 [Lentinula aciculospora]
MLTFLHVTLASSLLSLAALAFPVDLTSLHSLSQNATPPNLFTRDGRDGAHQHADKHPFAIAGYIYTDELRAKEFNQHYELTTFPAREHSMLDTGSDFPLGGGAYLEPVPWSKQIKGVWECVVAIGKENLINSPRVQSHISGSSLALKLSVALTRY